MVPAPCNFLPLHHWHPQGHMQMQTLKCCPSAPRWARLAHPDTPPPSPAHRSTHLLRSSAVRSLGSVLLMPSFLRRRSMTGAKRREPSWAGGHSRLKRASSDWEPSWNIRTWGTREARQGSFNTRQAQARALPFRQAMLDWWPWQTLRLRSHTTDTRSL